VSLRYFNVAGATETLGEVHDPETHLIPNVLAAAERDGSITVFGDDYPTPDGTCVRDYIHVADLADAHLRAIEATAQGDPRTADALVCNLGNGDGFSVREVLAAAETVVGHAIAATAGPRRPGDPPVLVARADRAAGTPPIRAWRRSSARRGRGACRTPRAIAIDGQEEAPRPACMSRQGAKGRAHRRSPNSLRVGEAQKGRR
jgi:UDP-glucose 4-epimerase